MTLFGGAVSGVIILPAGYQDIQDWIEKNAHVTAMHEIAVEDYIAARHSVLALGLFTVGFALAAQAIEKLLKCYLMLGGAQLADMKKQLHKLDSLLSAAAEDNPSLLARQVEFGGFCSKLQAWYQSRYPFAPGSASEWMRADISCVDDMVVYLEEEMPLPANVASLKYSGGNQGLQWNSVFVRLFSALSQQHREALLSENAALEGRELELRERFLDSRKACLHQAQTAEESLASRQKLAQEMDVLLSQFRSEKPL